MHMYCVGDMVVFAVVVVVAVVGQHVQQYRAAQTIASQAMQQSDPYKR